MAARRSSSQLVAAVHATSILTCDEHVRPSQLVAARRSPGRHWQTLATKSPHILPLFPGGLGKFRGGLGDPGKAPQRARRPWQSFTKAWRPRQNFAKASATLADFGGPIAAHPSSISGRPWQSWADFGRPWQNWADSGRPWQNSADPGRIGQTSRHFRAWCARGGGGGPAKLDARAVDAFHGYLGGCI